MTRISYDMGDAVTTQADMDELDVLGDTLEAQIAQGVTSGVVKIRNGTLEVPWTVGVQSIFGKDNYAVDLSSPQVSLVLTPANILHLPIKGGILAIDLNTGAIDLGGVELDDAARGFWDAVKLMGQTINASSVVSVIPQEPQIVDDKSITREWAWLRGIFPYYQEDALSTVIHADISQGEPFSFYVHIQLVDKEGRPSHFDKIISVPQDETFKQLQIQTLSDVQAAPSFNDQMIDRQIITAIGTLIIDKWRQEPYDVTDDTMRLAALVQAREPGARGILVVARADDEGEHIAVRIPFEQKAILSIRMNAATSGAGPTETVPYAEIFEKVSDPVVAAAVRAAYESPHAHRCIDVDDIYTAASALEEPMDWDEGGRVHNWKNYVGRSVQRIWDTFSPVQKIAIAVGAHSEAMSEHWD